jgi:hypothetical protein
MVDTGDNVVVYKDPSGFEIEAQSCNVGMLTRSLIGGATTVVPFGRAYFERLRAQRLGESGSSKYVFAYFARRLCILRLEVN